jgi:biopolymer transport protein ExbB/TolQ
LIHVGPLRDTVLRRYVSHPVEYVEVVMFCGAVGILIGKVWGNLSERRACHCVLVPPWDGRAVPLSEAGKLLSELNKQPARFHKTVIVKRTAAVLEFLCHRGSASELDDHLRSLADNDALALEGSYSLTRFITWAIPILGFLGTVLGITGAISGVTPEVLENSLSTVTDGLALAFDATALALGLTMGTMFLTFLVERAEQSILDSVDRYVDRELAHRFLRAGAEGGEYVEIVRQQTNVLVQAIAQLVERQASLWAKVFDEAEKRRVENEQKLQERLRGVLEQAMDRTLQTHSQRLATLSQQTDEQASELVTELGALAKIVQDTGREQRTSLAQIAEGIARQLEVLSNLEDSEKHLHRLQETLSQNLAALAGAGSFEQAVHSLTAAIHLLTARAAVTGAGANRLGARPGAAA